MKQPALFWEALAGSEVVCRLCPHYCRLRPGQAGLCLVRQNEGGRLVTSAFGQPVLLGVEPMEKKYLFHVWPGSQTLSLGVRGCNMTCRYCINWRVSQAGSNGEGGVESVEARPEAVVAQAQAAAVAAIAFTYTEPTIFLEYVLAIAPLARAAGLGVVAKSNGYMGPGVLERLAPWLDGINIDLKGWQPTRHRQVTGGELAPVLDNLRLARRLGMWLEVSTLLTPGMNDSRPEVEAMARFVAGELGRDTPWHLLRFFPAYQMQDRPPTSQATLGAAVEAAQRAGLRYVYAKDLAQAMLHTTCPGCGHVVLRRSRFGLVRYDLKEGKCGECGEMIPGVGLAGVEEPKFGEKRGEVLG